MNISLQEHKNSNTYPDCLSINLHVCQSGHFYLHSIDSEIRCVNETEEERLGGEFHRSSFTLRDEVFGPGIEIQPLKLNMIAIFVAWGNHD